MSPTYATKTAQAQPLRLLLSDLAAVKMQNVLVQALGSQAFRFVSPHHDEVDADIAFVTRDVTGLSTKHEWLPETRRFYEAMRHAPSLDWVHVHSAGADRQIFLDLMARNVRVTTSSGTNASVVAQTALAGLLALARRLPQLMAAQRAHTWAPLIQTGLPPDLAGQTAVIVGWGPIGQQIAAVLSLLGVHVVAVRRYAEPAATSPSSATFTSSLTSATPETITYAQLGAVLPRTDWLVLACPLTAETEGLLDAPALAKLPASAHVVNVARGEVIDEAALLDALQHGRLAGAYLDVFAHEPLAAQSALWDLPNVILTPHSAGFSGGNAQRVEQRFLDNLKRWISNEPLLSLASR